MWVKENGVGLQLGCKFWRSIFVLQETVDTKQAERETDKSYFEEVSLKFASAGIPQGFRRDF